MRARRDGATVPTRELSIPTGIDGLIGVRSWSSYAMSDTRCAQIEQWRMDPERGGVATAVADVGTHAFHLLRYITGLEATRISAELSTLVPGRPVFDNATMRLTLSNGAPATVWATMAATGHEHGLRIRVFGDDASLEWRHEDPQHLIVRDPGGGSTILAQGMSSAVRRRRPPHPRRAGPSRRLPGGVRQLLSGPN